MSLQDTIIQQLGVKPVINPQEEIRRSIDFLKRYLKKHPFLKTFVLGISGGTGLDFGRTLGSISHGRNASRNR